MSNTPKSQWEYIYQSVPQDQIPWETGQASPDLVRLFHKKIIRKGMKVLDVGCGLGTQTRSMAKRGVMATGIDISETAIKRAREQLLKEDNVGGQAGILANFVVGDVGRMPFPNASFDFVYDRGCYHHLQIKERKAYAKEVARILNMDGILHMLVFAGSMTASEVADFFLPTFQALGAYEDVAVDHTNNNQQIPIHIVQFKKI